MDVWRTAGDDEEGTESNERGCEEIMSITMIIIETVILLILFTAGVMLGSRNPVDTVYDMPQPIIDRCLELGLIDETKRHDSRETKIKKLTAALLIAVVLALVMYFVNGAKTFLQAFLVSYIIWLVIDWYDCLVIDWIWVCHSKKIIIPGTEDLVESYKDYKFHAIGSMKGMVIGLPVCALVGILVQLIAWMAK